MLTGIHTQKERRGGISGEVEKWRKGREVEREEEKKRTSWPYFVIGRIFQKFSPPFFRKKKKEKKRNNEILGDYDHLVDRLRLPMHGTRSELISLITSLIFIFF